MGLKATVDTLDDVAAHFHELYTENADGKFQLTGVEGMKPQLEFDKVHGGLAKERNDHKVTKAELAKWGALGALDEIQARLDRVTELETIAGGKLDEAGINKLVEGRLNSKTAPLERQIQQHAAAIAEKDALIGQFQAKETQRTIHDSLREALKKHEGFQPSAFDDAAMLAERMFELDDSGRVVTKDGVGVTPGVDAAVWLTEMQQKRPHWWGPSVGGGATGSKTGGGGNNPFSFEHWNMTEQGKLMQNDPTRAAAMAKAAGTTVGGPKPAPRR